VYGLEVEECPMFFAAGLLVANCDALQYLSLHYNQQVNPAAGMYRRAAPAVVKVNFPYV